MTTDHHDAQRQLRFDCLVRSLRERQRLAELVEILSQALPPELVAQAHRIADRAA